MKCFFVENKKKELDRLKKEIEENKIKIQKIDSKIELEKGLNNSKLEFKSKSEEKEIKEKEIKELVEEINRKSELFKTLLKERGLLENRLEEIKKQKIEIEELGLEPIDFESTDSLENIYSKIKLFNKDRTDLKLSKERTFDKLKDKVKSALASEDDFIKYVDEEIDCLPDKRNSIDGYLQAISVQFANPAASLIRHYDQ